VASSLTNTEGDVLTGKEIILGLLLFFILGMAAGLIGFILTRTEKKEDKKEKPRAWLAGIVAIIGGLIFGYAAMELILTLNNQPN
jgi:uncharacterized membrane protein YedE/YeeE